MKLIDYIHEGYSIVTSRSLGRKIKDSYPNVLIFTDNAFDGIPHGNLLVDRYYRNHPAVLSTEPYQDSFVVENFTNEFVGAKTENTFKAELGKTYDQDGNEPLYETKQEPNLLEIKLKDTDSVPEVYYKGEKLGKYPECLVDISYHWKVDDFSSNDCGANDINIEYYSTPNDRCLDRKTIGHKRDM